MTATAVRPRKPSAQARASMTPEQELEYLIADQAADDTARLSTPGGQVSLNATTVGPGGVLLEVQELIEYDPWELVDAAIDLALDPGEVAYRGPVTSHLRRRRGDTLVDPRKIPHGTPGGYQNHGCRLVCCRTAWAEYTRDRRAAKRPEA